MGGHRTRRRRRLRPGKIITQVIVFLLLGAIVNVAVAWGCIAAWEWPFIDRFPAELRYLSDDELTWPRRVSEHWPAPHEAFTRPFTGGRATRFFGKIYESEDGHVRLIRTPATPLEEIDVQLLKRHLLFGIDLFDAGWPRRALGWECWEEQVVDETPSGQFQSHYVIVGHPSPTTWHIGLPPPNACPGFRGQDDDWKRLPLRPLWPGFIVNTLFYAIILWLLIPGPFVLRRVIRVKRGRCPQCGYDLRGQLPGAGCPECGWMRASGPTADRETV